MTEFVEVKTSELTGAALDWAVAQVEKVKVTVNGTLHEKVFIGSKKGLIKDLYKPSTDWRCGGPLIESEELTVEPSAWDWNGACVLWRAHQEGESAYFEHTNLLVAAMRAIAHAKLGDTVSVPKELLS